MTGGNEFGTREYGYDDSEAYGNLAANLPGILGLQVFGQPVWEIGTAYNPSHQTINFTGGCLVTSPSNPPYHNIKLVSGAATIKRRAAI